MRKFTTWICAFVVALIGFAMYLGLATKKELPGKYEQVGLGEKSFTVAYPNPELTPGDVLPGVGKEQVCAPGYSKSYRKELKKSEKKEIYKAYNVEYDTTKYQIDHFIPISIGGSHDPKNLWPQPIIDNIGFIEKQQVAQYLHEAVCRGDMEISMAQEIIRLDWHKVFNEIQEKKASKKKSKGKK